LALRLSRPFRRGDADAACSLIRIYLILDVNGHVVSRSEKWFVHRPFQIYLGWITVATIANISTLLFDAGWNGFGLSPVVWTLVMLTAGLIIAALMATFRRDVPYLLVLVWAFAGIGVAQADTAVVSIAAYAAAAVVAGMIFWVGYYVILTICSSEKQALQPVDNLGLERFVFPVGI
jgi:hypothetical protein